MLNLSADASAAVAERLQAESIAWITTVAPGGQPQSSPVWFLWNDGKFLVYAQPQSWKVRNIRADPMVSLHLNSDAHGGAIVTFEGTAHIADPGSARLEDSAYLEKYRAGIAAIGMTPEQLAAEFSTAVLITPTRVRVY